MPPTVGVSLVPKVPFVTADDPRNENDDLLAPLGQSKIVDAVDNAVFYGTINSLHLWERPFSRLAA
ncbi:MAG TPA: hypothetical protein VMU95_06980 [Trebonia sp.]|nr:hypothetical protein [Trebonia sp.]